MNLWQKIIEVRKSVDSLTKDVDKQGLKYTYVSGNQILSKIKCMMNDQGLILQPSIELGSHEQYDYKTQYGKEMTDFIVKGEMSYTWINAEKPEEREVIRWAYYGQQSDISKSLGSGLTYSERYFLLKYFGLPTDEDDPDLNQDKKSSNNYNTQPPKQPKPNKTVTEVDTMPSEVKTLSEKQVKRLYAIAIAKGWTVKSVENSVKAKYKLDNVNLMSKKQYDELCEVYEKSNHK